MAAEESTADKEARRKLQKPVCNHEKAAALALELYGHSADLASIKELDSYDDRNFYYRTTAGGGEFVLKVHNGVESEQPAFIHAQNAAMACVQAAPGLWSPSPCLSLAGNTIEFAELALLDGSPRRHAVRCLPFKPGKILGDVPPSVALLAKLGQYAGRADAALRSFEHAAAVREHMWDLRQTAQLQGLLQHLEPVQVGVVQGVLDEFGHGVLPRADELPAAVIHSDINDQNVLVDAGGSEVVGLIDYGDLVHSWQLNELAICAAYVLIYLHYDKWRAAADAAAEAAAGAPTPALEPLLALRAVCHAYHAERPLSDVEWAALPTLISCRLAMSLTIGMFSAAQARARARPHAPAIHGRPFARSG